MYKFFTFALLFLPFVVNAQTEQSAWRSLSDVTLSQKTVEGRSVDVPIFGREAKRLDGTVITIKGYILPYQLPGENTFIFSAYPNSSCYFCGGAGPESVMEVKSSKKIFYSAKPIVIRGRLKLNPSDYDHLMYILVDAERVDE